MFPIILKDVRIPGNRRSERFTALDPETAYTVRVRPVILIAEELIEGPAGQASASTCKTFSLVICNLVAEPFLKLRSVTVGDGK